MAINGNWYPFSEVNIRRLAPASAGVYALARGQEITYYGRAQGGSTTIESRLLDHLAGRDGACTQQATQFAWEQCSNPVAREKELQEEYKRLNGRLPRCNDRVG